MAQEDECFVYLQVKLLCTRPSQQPGQWFYSESTLPGCLVFHRSERHGWFYNYGTGLYSSELNDYLMLMLPGKCYVEITKEVDWVRSTRLGFTVLSWKLETVSMQELHSAV